MRADQLIRLRVQEAPDSYEASELGFYHAYEANLSAALRLYEGVNFKREAYLMLLISTECYLKDIYCALRYQWQQENGKICVPSFLQKKLNTLLSAREFGHDLHRIATAIKELCQGLDTDKYFLKFLSDLPVGSNWVNWRYGNPADDKRNYDKDFRNLSEDFKFVRDNTFRGYK